MGDYDRELARAAHRVAAALERCGTGLLRLAAAAEEANQIQVDVVQRARQQVEQDIEASQQIATRARQVADRMSVHFALTPMQWDVACRAPWDPEHQSVQTARPEHVTCQACLQVMREEILPKTVQR